MTDHPGAPEPPLLDIRSVTMRFGGTVALYVVTMAVPAGAITGLIGPNGAGKTTLFNCITGLLRPNSGEIRLDGENITKVAPFRRARRGIARTFQHLELFTSLSVLDNISVAGQIRNRWHDWRCDVESKATEVIDMLGLGRLAHREVSEIPTGMARRVEVGRALMTDPRLLLLDEPASGQDERDSLEFGDLLLELADSGVGILLVEHDVPLVSRLCSTVHVLDFGRLIASGTADEVRQNPMVVDAYLGAMVEPELS